MFFKNIWLFWVKTWQEDRFLFWCEAISVAASVIASMAMAFGSPLPNMLLVFSFYLVGSILLQISTYKRESSWLFLLMSWYTVMNVIGLARIFI